MPDPMTNLEIQDVLSSIRRLVSEDNRHRAERERAREAGETAVPAPAGTGKLVLTEALRVPGTDDAQAGTGVAETGGEDAGGAEADGAGAAGVPAAEAAPAGAEAETAGEGEALDQTVTGGGRFAAGETVPALAETETAGGDTWEAAEDIAEGTAEDIAEAGSLEDTIAELEAAVAGIGGEFEPDGSEVARARAVDAELEEAFEDGFAVDLAAEEEEARALAQPVTSGAVDPVGGEDAAPGPEAEEAAATDPLVTAEPVEEAPAEDVTPAEEAGAAEEATEEAAEAEAGAMPEDRPAADAAAPGEDAGAEGFPAFAHSAAAWRGATAAASSETMWPGTMLPDAMLPEAPRPAGLRRLTLTAADAVTEGPAPWDRGDAPPAAPEPAHLPEEAPGLAPALADEIPGSAAGEAEEDGSIFGPGEDGLIDMEMLRDIVAEIIREELQGPLGERITRNVRMLVRREINRALEARGLE